MRLTSWKQLALLRIKIVFEDVKLLSWLVMFEKERVLNTGWKSLFKGCV